MIVLKKYENRKIYWVKQHKYVTLKDIENIINTNDIMITNHIDNSDITRDVLISILSNKLKEDDSITVNDVLKFIRSK